MTTQHRLRELKAWLERECCQGRFLKTPGADGTVASTSYTEPRVFIGYAPSRPNAAILEVPEPASVCPSIILMFTQGYGERVQEQRFDRYSGIHRAKEMGGTLPVSMLLSVYEPGNRLDGFEENPMPEYLLEATEEGIFTLTDWMDAVRTQLLSASSIPGTDLLVWPDTITYAPYAEQGMLSDKRPFYFGFVNVEFAIYSGKVPNDRLSSILD